jgi:hypothetical protein
VLGHREELGVRVVVVGFAAPESLAAYRRRQGLDELLVLSDPQRRAYRAFGFDRGSVARVWLDPRVWRRYAQLIRRGRRIERSKEDTLQLGGDVLVDPDGRVRWIHTSRGPEDRPTIATLRRAIRSRLAGRAPRL